MRVGGVTRVSQEAKHIAAANAVSRFGANTVQLEMGVNGKMTVADVHNHVISRQGGERLSGGQGTRSFFRGAVFGPENGAIGD